MQSNNLTDIELAQSLGCVHGLHTQEMSGLGESINNNPYGIMPSCGSWKTRYEVHGDVIPLPLWDSQGL